MAEQLAEQEVPLAGLLHNIGNALGAAANACHAIPGVLMQQPLHVDMQQLQEVLNNALQQQTQVLQQEMQQQTQVLQQEMQQQTQALRQEMQAMQVEVQAQTQAVQERMDGQFAHLRRHMRFQQQNVLFMLNNRTSLDNQPIQWLYNDDGERPQVEVSKRDIYNSNVVDVNLLGMLINFYNLGHAVENMGHMDRRHVLLASQGAATGPPPPLPAQPAEAD